MRRALTSSGSLVAGMTVAGFLVGAGEALYRDAAVGYAALLYASGWGLAGSMFAAAALPLWRRRVLPAGSLFALGLGLALAASGWVLVQFVLRRDWFHEAPGAGSKAVVAGSLAALVLSAVVAAAFRLLRRVRPLARWASPRLWALPLATLGLFAIVASRGDDLPVDGPPLRARPFTGRGVVLVVVDALRADALGVYGAAPHRGSPASPRVDALAEEGRLFTRASAQASWTRPAVASLLTSRHASGHGVMAKDAVLPASLPTLAAVLADAGVATAAVVTNYNLEPAYGFQRGFADYLYLAPARYLGAPPSANRLAAYNTYRLLRERFFPRAREARYFYRPGDAVNAAAFRFLDRIGDRPFFLYLHYMEPHDPYFAQTGESYARVAMPRPPVSLAASMRVAYRDEVQRFDAHLAELLDGLDARGLGERTTLVFTADHGEEFADHGGFFHGVTLYEEQIHIPLVIAGPGVDPAVDTGLARQIDVAPTIAARLGVGAPPEWEGRDLLGSKPAPEVALAEEDHEGNVLAAIRVGDHKLVRANLDNPRGLPPIELYDLARDPEERSPMATGGLAAELDRRLTDELTRARHGAAPIERRAMDDASEAELRSLGYVQ